MTNASELGASNDLPTLPRRLGRGLESCAFVVLLLCVASRPFLGELPFRLSSLGSSAVLLDATGDAAADVIDRTELARVSFAVALAMAVVLWLLGGALAGSLQVRMPWLALGIAAFGAWSFLCARAASNQRDAWTTWLEQLSLLAGFFLAIQLCGRAGRFRTLVIVLAGVAGAMAVKAAWQIAVEAPIRIEDFRMYRAERLAELGWADGTPQATLIESRMGDRAPMGFFPLANLFASLMILLGSAATAVALEKLSAGIRALKMPTRKPGEIPLELLAAAISAIVAVASVATLACTRSRGAILAAGAAAVVGCIVWACRRKLAQHRRKWLTLAAAVFLLGVVAVIGYGRGRDGLPTRTMTFRWYYWTASAKIVRDHAAFGVGPGNFGPMYLHYRRPVAEEEIKLPHNVIVHAATQYGLPGAALYLGILACALIACTRPAAPQQAADATGGRGRWVVLAIIVAGVFLARWLFVPPPETASLVLETILPAAALGIFLAVAAWCVGRGHLPASTWRFALAAGLFAFALHNMVSFSLWVPGTAVVFWVAAGGCIARGSGGRERNVRWPIAVVLAVVAAGAVGVAVERFWTPVAVRTTFSRLATWRQFRADPMGATTAAINAAEADPLDPIAAADAARLLGALRIDAPRPGRYDAYDWAKRAIARDEANFAWHRLAAIVAAALAEKSDPDGPTLADAVAHMGRAVELNASDARLRIAFARMLLAAARYDECLAQLNAAEAIEAQLHEGSVEIFNPGEWEDIGALRAHVSQATTGPASKSLSE